MDPLQIVLIVLVIAGIWAVVELALVLRRTRSTVDSLDTTLEGLNETLADTKPVIEKLDTVLDDIQPALGQVEPLLKQGSIAIEALSADLIEVNGVLRDVSEVTGSMSSASDAVSGIATAATEKVQKLFGKHRAAASEPDHTLSEGEGEPAQEPESAPEQPEPEAETPHVQQYYTYSEPSDASDSNRKDHE